MAARNCKHDGDRAGMGEKDRVLPSLSSFSFLLMLNPPPCSFFPVPLSFPPLLLPPSFPLSQPTASPCSHPSPCPHSSLFPHYRCCFSFSFPPFLNPSFSSLTSLPFKRERLTQSTIHYSAPPPPAAPPCTHSSPCPLTQPSLFRTPIRRFPPCLFQGIPPCHHPPWHILLCHTFSFTPPHSRTPLVRRSLGVLPFPAGSKGATVASSLSLSLHHQSSSPPLPPSLLSPVTIQTFPPSPSLLPSVSVPPSPTIHPLPYPFPPFTPLPAIPFPPLLSLPIPLIRPFPFHYDPTVAGVTTSNPLLHRSQLHCFPSPTPLLPFTHPTTSLHPPHHFVSSRTPLFLPTLHSISPSNIFHFFGWCPSLPPSPPDIGGQLHQ
ncbi:unnamed protein product [Closterium sp. Naga37s-1]|nr:unnamed protein product [Closterium sp. Naga37s-1]